MLALPVLLVVLADLSLRGGRIIAFPAKYLGSYGVSVIESGVLWAVLLGCASATTGRSRWLGAASFVALGTMALGSQLYFYEAYSTYLNLDATLWGHSMADSAFGQLSADSKHFFQSVAPPLLLAVGLVWLGRRVVRTPRPVARYLALAAPLAVIAALALPCSYRSIQGSTPDVIYFHAMGGLIKQLTGIEERREIRPRRRKVPSLPALTANPAAPRNVIFVLTESVRADVGDVALAYSRASIPERIPLLRMRASSSTTAIQLAVLWSGLEPDAGREALHDSPLLFDYAAAAGIETAYWSSHHMLFANSRLYVQDLPTQFQCGATHLDPLADIDLGADDRLLSERAKSEIGRLNEPFFAVVHYGNTHTPYLIDPRDAPFVPHLASKAEDDNAAYKNYYLNAVRRQDAAVADLLRHVAAQPFAERTVIVYTSDHGEQFREHGQLGHTGSVFDIELLVPTWIAAPTGTLSDDERTALESYREQNVFHTDVAPTILDLLGLWPLEPSYREAMVGDSLLRPAVGKHERVLALTNCSGVWGCAFENWGVMQGHHKLLAREWDQQWLCYDIERDPAELSPLPLDSAPCSALQREAERRYKHLPGKAP